MKWYLAIFIIGATIVDVVCTYVADMLFPGLVPENFFWTQWGKDALYQSIGVEMTLCVVAVSVVLAVSFLFWVWERTALVRVGVVMIALTRAYMLTSWAIIIATAMPHRTYLFRAYGL